MNYRYFKPQDFTFQTIQETGDFRLIRDTELRRDLLKLKRYHGHIIEAQTNFQHALDNYIVPLVNENVDLARQRLITSEFKTDYHLTNLVSYTINDLNGRIKLCQRTLEFLEKLKSKVER